MAQPLRERFGRYELVSKLGRGGMAETWRARLLGAAGVTKPVLIKKVLTEYANDDSFIAMFISEARISATLSHGNIAQVFDFGRVDGDYFLAMELVDGQPLNRVMKRALKSGLPGIPPPLASFIVLEMCKGLHYAHTRRDDKGVPLGIVHRDISPDNVLLSYEGQVKIVDFGIAKARALRGFQTEPGVVKGKYLFFSPEQAKGQEVDARTDVWATGVVLYELLCGQLPVSGPSYTALPRLVGGEFPSPRELRPDVPEELDGIVMRALAVDKQKRFESCHAFGDALAGFLYSAAPRFSSMSVAHLVQELFREDLETEGREVHVPPSFVDELALWRSKVAEQDAKKELSPAVQTREAPVLEVSRRPWLIPAALLVTGMVGGLTFAALRADAPPSSEPGALQPIARVAPARVVSPPTPTPVSDTSDTTLSVDAPAATARGSAVFPASKAMVLDARRDVILVPGTGTRAPLDPGVSYRVSEPAITDDSVPVFFWLTSPVKSARGLQGTLSRLPETVSGGPQLVFFNLAPEHGQAPRWIQLENTRSRERSSLRLDESGVPSLERTFELKGLDESNTYALSLAPQNNWARTRGIDSEVVSSVVCVGSHPSALGPEPRPVLIPVDTETTIRGVNALSCGFLDEDPADNQGQAVVHVSQLPSLPSPAPPPRTSSAGTFPDGSDTKGGDSDISTLAFDAERLIIVKKQFREAESLLRTCLSLEPNNMKCLMLMGVVSTKLGRPDEAEMYNRKVQEFIQSHSGAHRPKQRVDNSRSMEVTDTTKLLADADKLIRQQQFDEAEPLLKRCLSLDPANARCFMLMGISYAKRGRTDDAARAYRRVIELNPNHPSAPKLRQIIEDYEKSKLKGR